MFKAVVRAVVRRFKRPPDPSGFVYYARLRFPQGTFYKVGYTSKPSLKERMSFGGHGDETSIDREFLFVFRKNAWDVEQTLLEHFDKHRAFGRFSNNPKLPLPRRGQSELFAYDILGLDSDLYRLSDEENEALKKAMGQANDGCLMVLLGLVLAPFTLGGSLLFIAGGLSGVFGSTSDLRPSTKQPQHPPKIKALINSLVQGSSMNNAAERPDAFVLQTPLGERSAVPHVER